MNEIQERFNQQFPSSIKWVWEGEWYGFDDLVMITTKDLLMGNCVDKSRIEDIYQEVIRLLDDEEDVNGAMLFTIIELKRLLR